MNFLITFALWVTILGVFIGALGLLRLARVHLGWLLLSLALLAGYFAIVFFGNGVIPLERYVGDLHWNWGGKLLAITVMMVIIAVANIATRGGAAKNVGFTLKQEPGSVVPALIVTGALVAWSVWLAATYGESSEYDLEELLFQATMPGLDEELFYRGLLLATLAAAVRSGRLNLLGAHIGWNGVCVTLLFGIGHGVFWQNGQPIVSWPDLAFTGGIGFALVWLRERTGSLLIPILCHNAFNLAQRFF